MEREDLSSGPSMGSDADSMGGRPSSDPRISDGTHIGPYQVIRTLGQGGMGTVYLAEQTEPVHRTVALKVIRFGMDSDLFLGRFQIERQALALMNHPSIAAVYDVGTTHSDRPYFAMELVEGEPITDYCDRHRFTIKQRLHLFLQVCHAMAHAHRKGIIHRDIKPNNILVVEQDGHPLPKVIDFGMAKATDPGMPSEEPRHGMLIGTPVYMSPEQIQGDGLDIDTRTDVYGMGILLYQLLVGAFPFDLDNLTKPSLYHRILIGDYCPPSVRVAELIDASDLARQRGTHASGLARTLRGELDDIVMKAIARNPVDRYGSVTELAEDIQRHLTNRVTKAGASTPWLRFKKFVLRHTVMVSAGMLLFFSLLLGVLGTTLGMIRAIEAKEEAVMAQKKAMDTVNYLEGVLSAADPHMDGRRVRVVDLLEKASRNVAEDLKNQPEVGASIRKTIGWTFLELGLYEMAEKELRQCLEFQTQHLGPDHPDTLHTRSVLGRLAYKMGRYREAEKNLREVMQTELRTLGPDHPNPLWSMYNLAKVLARLGRLDEAEKLYRQMVETRARILGPRHAHTLVAINALSLLLTDMGKHEEAERLQRQNLEALKATLGDHHPNTLNSMNNLVVILIHQGKWDEAEALCKRTMKQQEEVLGPDHPETLGSLDHMGTIFCRTGRSAEALPYLVEAHEKRREVLGPNHQDTLLSALHRSQCLEVLKRDHDACGVVLDAIQAAGGDFSKHGPVLNPFRRQAIQCLIGEGRPAEARPLLEQLDPQRTDPELKPLWQAIEPMP